MISVTILTKNSTKYLDQVLKALKDFPEVLVYDTGSTDDTMAIAARYPNVTIKSGPFKGFGPTHNTASNLAKHDWILSIDSDEIATPELVAEILALKLNPECVYSFPRKNYFCGKWIKWCGWYPDRMNRLYYRHRTRFQEAQVHEAVIADGLEQVPLEGAVIHYPYETISDFLKKMQVYSDLFASQYKGKRKSSTSKAVLHGAFTFFKSYILKRGFMGGSEGFIISAYNAHTAFYKYLKLAEKNKEVKVEE